VGDAGRLRQLLLNLIGNAVKFTVRGGVTVKVRRAAPATPDGIALRFEIIDSGIGIAPEILPNLFNAFTQGDPSVTRRFGGTGLGLAICRKIVECLGGRIGVDSRLGEGSCFWFELSFRPGAADGAPAAEADPAQLRPCPPTRILLAEDNLINQGIARAFLEAAGHSVSIVADGHEAVNAVRNGSFDVVLMDIQMPQMDGLEATRAIRGLSGPVARIPIIALSASAMSDDIEACRAVGMDDHVAKPIMPADLNAALIRVRGRQAAPPAPASPAPSGGVAFALDRARIDKLCDLLGQDQFQGLVGDLICQLEKLQESLNDASHCADLPAVGRIAHSIRGVTANFGLLSVMETAAAIEGACRRGDWSAAEAMDAVLRVQILQGTTALKNWHT
jgi:CheY-like chemotaxis protein